MNPSHEGRLHAAKSHISLSIIVGKGRCWGWQELKPLKEKVIDQSNPISKRQHTTRAYMHAYFKTRFWCKFLWIEGWKQELVTKVFQFSSLEKQGAW